MKLTGGALLVLSALSGCTLVTDFEGVSGGVRESPLGSERSGSGGAAPGSGGRVDAGKVPGTGGTAWGGATANTGGGTASGGTGGSAAESDGGGPSPVADGGAVGRVTDAGVVAVVVNDVDDPCGLFVDSDTLYVASRAGGLYAKALPDGPALRIDTLEAPAIAPFDVALLGDDLVWSDAGGTVYARALSGGTRRYVGAFSGDELYVTPGSDAVFLSGPGAEAVLRATVGTDPEGASIFIVPAGNGGIAWSDGVLYWGSAGAPLGVEEGDDQGGSHRSLVRDADGVSGVAARGTAVAWIGDERRVKLYDRVTRALRVIHEAASPFGDGDVALDEAFVYWSEPANGVVRRAPR